MFRKSFQNKARWLFEKSQSQLGKARSWNRFPAAFRPSPGTPRSRVHRPSQIPPQVSGGEEFDGPGVHEKKLGLSHRPTFRKNYLQPALDAGLIERTLPDKPNSRLQKYRRAMK